MITPKIAIALGSGGARGWSHIGVLQGLLQHGIKPSIVGGTSIGSLVGGAYACDKLGELQHWVESLTWKDIITLFDVSLGKGGIIQGNRVLTQMQQRFKDQPIEDLPMHYTAVATELESGREVWLQKGSLYEAMRASSALPGLFSPVARGERWLTDGGLVNPVPVSVCRAAGADFIIAVNLNRGLTGKRSRLKRESTQSRRSTLEDLALQWLPEGLQQSASDLIQRTINKDDQPGYSDVLISSIHIMQDRITRSRMAGDPPDVVISPRLGTLGFMDYDNAGDTIEAGRKAAEHMLPHIEDLLSKC